MEKYVKVYSFEAMDKVAEGKAVYMLDKKRLEVSCVNGLSVSKFAEVMNAKDATGRYDFWYIEDGEAIA